jgi:hypothetical protein
MYRFAILIFCLPSSACATIFSGTQQMLSVNSEPPGAKIYLNNQFKGRTPALFEIKRKLDAYSVVLKKDSFEDYNGTLENRLNPVAIVNLFDVLGWGIDAVSGALMKYDESVDFTMEPLPEVSTGVAN